MSLSHQFKSAARFVDALDDRDRSSLETLCVRIRQAEEMLTGAAAALLDQCIKVCGGICCRNIALDTIIDTTDFVFVLGLDRGIGEAVFACLEKEDPLYTADCPFLRNGAGPCLFPFNLRPQVCITAFCGNNGAVGREIRRVKTAFIRLGWFVWTRKIRILGRRIPYRLPGYSAPEKASVNVVPPDARQSPRSLQ